jgi:hypothetical protein
MNDAAEWADLLAKTKAEAALYGHEDVSTEESVEVESESNTDAKRLHRKEVRAAQKEYWYATRVARRA